MVDYEASAGIFQVSVQCRNSAWFALPTGLVPAYLHCPIILTFHHSSSTMATQLAEDQLLFIFHRKYCFRNLHSNLLGLCYAHQNGCYKEA
jgi:hypothetical protein